jgi:catechol 2,3-dioxygenase-like lactoylglutathione lyase family enzyme
MTSPSRKASLFAIAAPLAAVACATPTGDTMSKPQSQSPLQSAVLCGFAATTDGSASRAFYEKKLGFRVVSDDPMALVLDACGQPIRIQKLRQHTPQTFTILGWNVRDIAATVQALEAAGVEFMRIEGFRQDPHGIMDFPGGARVAWFKDPDGNTLSVAQLER